MLDEEYWDIPVYEPECYEVVYVVPSQIIEAQEQARLTPPKIQPEKEREADTLRKDESLQPHMSGKGVLVLLALGAVVLIGIIAHVPSHSPSQDSTPSFQTISIPANSGDYTVTQSNELSPDQINAILKYYGSPYQGEGQDIYDLGQQYGIDDIYFLADYRKESSFGNSVLASAPYYNPTGMECSDLAQGCTGADGNGRNWGTWTSPRNGYEAWFKQISERYVSGAIDGGYRLTTIWLIACGPAGTGMYDGGSGCNQYASDIERWVDTWRAGKL